MPHPPIRKAVIPAAGLGTRLFPATKAVTKAFFPIIDREGQAKPAILKIVEEAIQAGIESVAIVVQERDRALFEDFFNTPPSPQLRDKLTPQQLEYCHYLQTLGQKVTPISQDTANGLGDAVLCAKAWVEDEPFLLLLGDRIYTSFVPQNCARQLIDVHQNFACSVVGIRIAAADEIHHYGCIAGNWHSTDAVLEISQIREKPSLDYARSHLRVRGMSENEFISVFGMYVLTPSIFEILATSKDDNSQDGEIQLSSSLELLRAREGMMGYLVKGKSFDLGLPNVYRQTLLNYHNTRSPVP